MTQEHQQNLSSNDSHYQPSNILMPDNLGISRVGNGTYIYFRTRRFFKKYIRKPFVTMIWIESEVSNFSQ